MLTRFFIHVAAVLFFLGIFAVAGVVGIMLHYGRNLPDISQLSHYEPPNTTRLYAGNGKLMEEYAVENRLFVPVTAVPERVIQAFLAAEDRNFYEHGGVDFTSIFRAAYVNISSHGQDRGLVGGSTITQQVIKNFLLTNEKTLGRKVKEAILAFRVSHAFSKDRILELYLNQIYLGRRSYGVVAAALNYFNKSVDELTIEEAALLAAMPKSPVTLDPVRNPQRALERRNWVIDGMQEVGFITAEEAKAAKNTPIALRNRSTDETTKADYFAEEVRRWMIAKYGFDQVYKGGYSVRTTLDPILQRYAEEALTEGLAAYDHKHSGYRGAIKKLQSGDDWQKSLAEMDDNQIPVFWHYAYVTESSAKEARIKLKDGSEGVVLLSDSLWASVKGRAPSRMSTVLAAGDIIAVEKKAAGSSGDEGGSDKNEDKTEKYYLRQIPQLNGALIVMDPHTGRVLAMVGGFGVSDYNRVSQARRQPGSAFKPFVYLTALENGFSPSSIIVDGPITLSQGAGMPSWSPQNYSNDFLGPTTLRVGLEKSRNAMTVRLSLALGIDRIIDVSKRFGIYDDVARNFSFILGALETTPLKLTNAYSIIANGGYKVEPRLIDRIQDRYGKTIYKWDERVCQTCADPSAMDAPEPPILSDTRERILDPVTAYQMTSILKGVCERGTAAKAKELLRPVAGKTGTTNDSHDVWFIGYTPDLVVGTYMGFDQPKSLGHKETGGSAALPVFMNFLQRALKDVPAKPFPVPKEIRLVRVDRNSGQAPWEGTADNQIILEAFRADGTRPQNTQPLHSSPGQDEGGNNSSDNSISTPQYYPPDEDYIPPENSEPREYKPTVGTGGIY